MTLTDGLISLADLRGDDFLELVYAAAAAPGKAPSFSGGVSHVVGGLFALTSTRTRTSFASAAHRLTGSWLDLQPERMQLATGESRRDTFTMLGLYLDSLVVRAQYSCEDLRTLRHIAGIPIINAMSTDEHPTQAIADLAAILSLRGSLKGLRLLYVGEGNSTAAALGCAFAHIPEAELVLACPRDYGVPTESQQGATISAAHNIHEVTTLNDIDSQPFDVVYTTQWTTTGTEKEDPDWRHSFEPFQVTESLLRRHRAHYFMHDLPARPGDEVTESVLYGPSSIVKQQARMKLCAAQSVLAAVHPDSVTTPPQEII